MHREELIVDVSRIPLDREGIDRNLHLLSEHAQYLEEIPDIKDPLVKGLLDAVPTYIRKQVERLRIHLTDEADIVAWISRNLMELFFMLRYMYSSRERYDEVVKEQLKDLKEIENIIYPNGSASEDAPNEVKAFHSDMKVLWETIEKYEVKRADLKRPKAVKDYAEDAGLLQEYNRGWRIHSKYVHPTSYILFGRRSSIYGEVVRDFFWIMAQYYAARNLRDIHGMIEAGRAHEYGT